MTVVSAKTSLRRAGVRQQWDRLRRSDALQNMFEEFALWTALWMGFPLSDTRREA
jgi:hypothetical protein